MEPIPGLKIRLMTDRDFKGIDDVDKRITGKEWAGPVVERASSHFWGYNQDLCFVAEIDDTIVGFLIGNMGGREYSLPPSGWVNIIGVDPEHRDRGIGWALMKSFIDVCQRKRITARFLIPRNKPFEKMLSDLGFGQGELVEWVRKPE